MSDKKYEYIRVDEAENGFSVEYTEKTKNPMEAPSTFGDNYSYKSKAELFSTANGDTMLQALDKAVARQKQLLLANLGVAPENKG